MRRCSARTSAGFAALVLALCVSARAEAQSSGAGFGVERFSPSAPGGGWFVMDQLDLDGGLRGAMSATAGYARNPLVVGDGARRLAVVSDQAFTAFGFAVGYDRFRLDLDLSVPVLMKGQSGKVLGQAFTAPSFDVGTRPDLISDARIGFDARIFGGPRSAFRLGASAQLFIPSGSRYDYVTDATFRGMFRALFAGDTRGFTYAGHVGVHVRPLDDAATLGSPRGSELLFGVAAGPRWPIGRAGDWSMVVGPEVFGATAFRSFFGPAGTAVEGLLSTRFEGTVSTSLLLRVKVGAGVGSRELGAPESRVLGGIEVSARQDAEPPAPPPAGPVPR
jgi:hypothetical protein